MSHPTDYRGPDGYLPWQREPDDAKALRLYIEHFSSEYPMRDAWVVTETGDGQRFTAFSNEARAENFAGEVRAELPEVGRYGGDVKPRVLVNKVSWPAGMHRATVISWLNDSIAEDFILAIPPVPFVAYSSPEFRKWGIGGPDNVIDGYTGVLELDGGTQEGGW